MVIKVVSRAAVRSTSIPLYLNFTTGTNAAASTLSSRTTSLSPSSDEKLVKNSSLEICWGSRARRSRSECLSTTPSWKLPYGTMRAATCLGSNREKVSFSSTHRLKIVSSSDIIRYRHFIPPSLSSSIIPLVCFRRSFSNSHVEHPF